MKVYVPGPLRSYTKNKTEVECCAMSLRGALDQLDRDYPGMRFRMIDEQDGIRQNIRFFINGELEGNLDRRLDPTDQIHIICAISGGREPAGWEQRLSVQRQAGLKELRNQPI